MANFAATSAAILVHDTDVGQFLEKFAMKVDAAPLEVTTFGQTWRNRIGGLKTTALTGSGFNDFSATGPDPSFWSSLGIQDQVVTVCPQGAETNTAYFVQAGRFQYAPLEAKVGAVSAFAVMSMSTNKTGT